MSHLVKRRCHNQPKIKAASQWNNKTPSIELFGKAVVLQSRTLRRFRPVVNNWKNKKKLRNNCWSVITRSHSWRTCNLTLKLFDIYRIPGSSRLARIGGNIQRGLSFAGPLLRPPHWRSSAEDYSRIYILNGASLQWPPWGQYRGK